MAYIDQNGNVVVSQDTINRWHQLMGARDPELTAARDLPKVKLGKAPPRHDARTLSFGDYLRRDQLPHPPPSLSLADKVASWPMMGNDKYSDCVFADLGHQVELWTAMLGAATVVIPDDQILAAYAAVTGFDPATGANDNGTVELDALRYMRSTGLVGHTIDAFCAVRPHNHTHVKQALELFGGVTLGVNLPESAQAQTGAGQLWDTVHGPSGAPGSWGGHAVPIVAYNEHTVSVVTWGFVQQMTWRFFDRYCDEAWALLSADWRAGAPIPGFDFAALDNDLAKIGQLTT